MTTLFGEYVFLSYAKEDQEMALRICKELQRHRISVWFDEHLLNGGDDWERQIRQGISGARLILLCLSTKSLTKNGYVQKELRMALSLSEARPLGDVFIIPIRLDDCVPPPELQKYQYVDCFRRGALQQLARTTAKRLGITGMPIPLPRKHRKTSRFKGDLDAFFLQEALEKNPLLVKVPPLGQIALTNGIWIDLNPQYLFPKFIHEVTRTLDYQVIEKLVDQSRYKRADQKITGMQFYGESMVKLTAKKASIFIDRRYFNALSLRYACKEMYISLPYRALIVEEREKPSFCLMPLTTPSEETP